MKRPSPPIQSREVGPDPTERVLRLPAALLSLVRLAVREEVGDLSAARILQSAGSAFGEILLPEFLLDLEAQGTRNPRDLDEAHFWFALNRFLGERGWGQLQADRVHPGLAVLYAHSWAEGSLQGNEGQPGCHFTAGLLSYFLSHLAGGPIVVLEAECVSAGDGCCTFLFGSEGTVTQTYELLLEGIPLNEVIVRL